MRTRLFAAALLLVLAAGTTPRATHPPITWSAGDRFLDVDGIATLTVSANPYGVPTVHGSAEIDFTTLFQQLAANGTRIVRIHVATYFNYQYDEGGDTQDEAWIAAWDAVFAEAEANGLHLLPVLDVWANWNSSMGWNNNVFNAGSTNYNCSTLSDCGPATTPADLLVDGSPTQLAWLDMLEYWVTEWSDHDNIVAWEAFSELDLIEGHNAEPCPVVDGTIVTQACAVVRLFEALADRIDDHDARPITASTAGVNDMPALWTSTHLDWGQLHPYAGFPPYSGDLDQLILEKVRVRLSQYGKPVFIGESGMDTIFPTDKVNTLHLKPRGWIGINHAIWAGAVSGAMNARALWFEDGYDDVTYDVCTHAELGVEHAANPVCADGNAATILRLSDLYHTAALPVVNFTAGVDYGGFEPVPLTDLAADDLVDGAGDLLGAAVGDSDMVVGWVRDVQSDAPLCTDSTGTTCTYDLADHWPSRLLSGEQVTVHMPAGAASADWLIEFWDTCSGALPQTCSGTRLQTIDADQDGSGDITFTLPDFEGSIAFKVYPVAPLAVTIDVTPGRANNRIQRSPGPLLVAIISVNTGAGYPADFDATSVVVSSVAFGPDAAPVITSTQYDVDTDGTLDLLLRFRKQDTGLPCGVSAATLTGYTNTGRLITGSAFVRVVGCPP